MLHMIQLYLFVYFLGVSATPPQNLQIPYCIVGSECTLSFSDLPLGRNSANQGIYLSQSEACDASVNPKYEFSYIADSSVYSPSGGHFNNYPLNSATTEFTICWWSSITVDTPVHYVLSNTLTVYGPLSDQVFSCELGSGCTLEFRGNLVNESSIVIVDHNDACGASTPVLLDLANIGDQPFHGVRSFQIGETTRSPIFSNYRVCWSSKSRELAESDFRVNVGVLEFSGPTRLTSTATCQLGESTSCSLALSSPGYLRISEPYTDCGTAAKLRLKLSSGENPVYSASGNFVFGSIRGAPIHRDLALCWGSNGDEFPVFVGNFRFSLPSCSSALNSAVSSGDLALVTAALLVEDEPLCVLSSGITSLDAVVAASWGDAVDALVERGANFDQTNEAGETAFFAGLAGASEDAFLSAFITKTGCDLRVPSGQNGLSPVHAAISAGRTALLVEEMLPRLGRASLEIVDPMYGAAPLIWAAQANDNAVLEALLNRGVDVKTADARGRSALHFAAMAGNVEAVQMLLRFCCPVAACVEWRDERSLSVRDVAKNDLVTFWLDEYAADTQGCAKQGI